jgi:hypothetical protein
MERPGARPYNLVLFHMPKDDDDENNFDGKGVSYYVLTELAKHERFLYDWRDMGFFMIENVNCMAKFGMRPQ